ncbi:hypothetical protein AAVH_31255, partial [Aphelenchoides avenae]
MVRLLEETIEPEMPSEMEKLQDQTLYMMRFNCRRQKGNLWLEGYNASVCFCSGDEIRVENTFKHVPQPPSQNVIPSTPLSDPSNATSSNESCTPSTHRPEKDGTQQTSTSAQQSKNYREQLRPFKEWLDVLVIESVEHTGKKLELLAGYDETATANQ